MNVRAMTTGVVTTLFALSAAGAAPTTKSAPPKKPSTAPLKLTINGRPEHPTVYLTPADITQARSGAAALDAENDLAPCLPFFEPHAHSTPARVVLALSDHCLLHAQVRGSQRLTLFAAPAASPQPDLPTATRRDE